MDGLRYAYNLLKHEMSFIKLFKATAQKEFFQGSDLYLEDFSAESIWLDAEHIAKENKKSINERENYKKYVEGKKVVETVEGACRFLRKLYLEIDQNNKIQSKSDYF